MPRPFVHSSRFLAIALFSLSGAVTPLAAQARVTTAPRGKTLIASEDSKTAAATGWTLLGATSGAVLGGLVGGVIGAYTASGAPPCQIGDPDGCLGATIPRALWGTGIGITIGTPVGAHLGNRRRGRPVYALLVSTALFAGEVVALRSLVHDGRSEHKNGVIGIAVGVPVLQIVASTIVERRTSSR